jgi:hypothetical protein
MRVRFNGGPWDGVEFEAPFYPDTIGFRHEQVRLDPVKGKPLVFESLTAERNHHQYLFDQPKLSEGVELEVGVNLAREPKEGDNLLDLVDESVIVVHYRYAPTEGPWWEDAAE